jgi:hypothetical protein
MHEAADRIEELEADCAKGQADYCALMDRHDAQFVRIKELEAKLATCEKYRDAYAESDRIGTQAVRDLETKLQKAMEALETIAGPHNWASPHAGLGGSMDDDLRIVARTTLAELKGEDRG